MGELQYPLGEHSISEGRLLSLTLYPPAGDWGYVIIYQKLRKG